MAKVTAASANRRAEIVAAAIEVFAEIGYYRATTAQVAELAAISQPYVYRFFTKESLLVEALEVSWQRIIGQFQSVIDSASPEQLEDGLTRAYEAVMQSHRHEILLQMQAQTINEPAVRQSIKQGMGSIQQMVVDAFQQAGIDQAEARTTNFLARGMLCNVSMALDMPELFVKG
ncbi:TetR/AcrR family transcriptional regulator [Paenibacillus radicis (ex Gao et al. 2016)]|uniref:HTH tetR-type domain-containing protein n=1 Tax=Paenibacillus radicis (ex Gao et al. 2016) TaxID=1737354 RepID=A0A917GRW7_9BACL|nr:TetR/AcrR family transcriptional regulator [Paenibacillus radicis (ex Gao et al. 2016)]GGG54661.1 hypothetical protein GCM10010918_04410 [Paenibacillus radicis (ex Gao et al. 2016)]